VTDPSTDINVPGMKPVEPPAGMGEEPMGQTTVRDLNVLPVATGRDIQTDCYAVGDPGIPGVGEKNLDNMGYLSDMNVTSLGNEKRRGGWDPLATPYVDGTGESIGAIPRVVNTSGTRGADDITPVVPDGSMP
jgi:hypothetical protein